MIDFAFRDQCGILAVHSHKHTESVAEFIYDSLYHIVFLIRRIAGKFLIHFHSRTETRTLVNVETYEYAVALFHWCRLLTEREEKIFLQSPVEECSILPGVDDFQYC